jgi:hypothetical protein
MSDEAVGADEAAEDSGAEWFALFTLDGARFKAEGMPTDSAVEVDHYRDAIFEAARVLWLADNPDRTNVPTNFDKAFDLRLVKVDQGSARTRVKLHRDSRYEQEWYGYYERGRDAITGVVEDTAVYGAVPADVTPRVRHALRKVGRTLEPDEKAILGEPAEAGRHAELTLSVRSVLTAIDEVLPPEHEEAEVTGVIVEFDSRGQTFELLRDPDGIRVECRLPSFIPALSNKVREVMATDGVTAPDVKVSGFAVLDSAGLFTVLSEVTSVDVVRPYWEKRLRIKAQNFAALEEGWRGPGSAAPDETVIAHLEEVIPILGALDVHVAVAPSVEGHAVLEWRRGDVEYTAEIEPRDRLYMCLDDRVTGRLEDAEVAFDVSVLRVFAQQGIFVGRKERR